MSRGAVKAKRSDRLQRMVEDAKLLQSATWVAFLDLAAAHRDEFASLLEAEFLRRELPGELFDTWLPAALAIVDAQQTLLVRATEERPHA